ncbi:MAG: hypothetical protein VX223_09440 [Myxococcota bacterium]|nr:hypothetical protein [Myxococcota bacterium]
MNELPDGSNPSGKPVFAILRKTSLHSAEKPWQDVPSIIAPAMNSSIWRQCKGQGITHLITLDPHIIEPTRQEAIINELIRVSRLEPDAYVYAIPDGSRKPTQRSFMQRIHSWRTDSWVRLLTACPVTYVWGANRILPVEPLSQLASSETEEAWALDMMVRGAWGDLPLIEVPLPVQKPRPTRSLYRLRWSLFLRWLVIIPFRPKTLLGGH